MSALDGIVPDESMLDGDENEEGAGPLNGSPTAREEAKGFEVKSPAEELSPQERAEAIRVVTDVVKQGC